MRFCCTPPPPATPPHRLLFPSDSAPTPPPVSVLRHGAPDPLATPEVGRGLGLCPAAEPEQAVVAAGGPARRSCLVAEPGRGPSRGAQDAERPFPGFPGPGIPAARRLPGAQQGKRGRRSLLALRLFLLLKLAPWFRRGCFPPSSCLLQSFVFYCQDRVEQ